MSKAGIDNWFEVHLKYLQNKSAEEIEAHFYAFYKTNDEKETEWEESVNRKIIFDKRDEDGNFTYDKNIASENEKVKLHNLEKIYERNRRIFGQFDGKTIKPK